MGPLIYDVIPYLVANAYGMLKDMAENTKKWEGRKILLHTGGFLGCLNKVEQMAPSLGNWRRTDVQESIPRSGGIGKMFSVEIKQRKESSAVLIEMISKSSISVYCTE
ncbi:hypothetical protein Pyn_23600 [Prunus yedoensis var. nudiflora]|uniref:Uncharacterized protein n=1 Tax=Prunus yedoensis var. nudiflora TaxID=2094558 RepID=A0A314V2E7_PRUYE|nr:hypothetical protein Pyn_23600 [Prunus yedoensis var. nudiflora]